MRNILTEVFTDTWLIENGFAQGYYPALFSMLKGDAQQPISSDQNTDQAAAYSTRGRLLRMQSPYLVNAAGQIFAEYDEVPEDGNYNLVVPVKGAITKYDYCGALGTQSLIAYINVAAANANIKELILDIDSGGGAMHGTLDLVNAIKAIDKPTTAFVNGMAASAAYWIAAACDKIVMNSELAVVGSIGVYTTIADAYGYYKKQGVNIEDVYAPQSSEKNAAFREFQNKGTTTLLTEHLREACEYFHGSVKAMRSQVADAAYKGDTYYADDALSLGLADAIGSLSELYNSSLINPQTTSPDMNLFGKKKTDTVAETPEQILAERNALRDTQASIAAIFGDDAQAEGFDLVASVTQLANEHIALTESNETLTAQAAELTESVTSLNAQVAELGGKAATHPIVAIKKEKVDTTGSNTNDPNKIIAELPHNKALEDNPLFN